METLKEVVIDVVLAVFLFTVTAGAHCHVTEPVTVPCSAASQPEK
jgi:hypothetical protein